MQTAPHQPLHRKVLSALRQRILEEHRPGERLESQNKIARRYRVSVMTAREALSALVEEGLIERRQGSGTYVRECGSKRRTAILMEIDIAHPRTSVFYRQVVQHLRAVLRGRGLFPKLYLGEAAPDSEWTGELSCKEFGEDLHAHQIEGVAAVGLSPKGAWFEDALGTGVPLVGGSSAYPHRVLIDHDRIIRMGVEHLHAQGRRKIACISWGGLDAFRRAIRDLGLAVREEWVRADLHPSSLGAGWKELRDIWTAGEEKPDGLLVADDMLFADVRSGLLEMRVHVPEQLMVVTHANRGASYPASFPVAKIEVDPDEYAEALGGMLADLLERKPRVPEEIDLPIRLVTEDTSERLDAWQDAAAATH
ncbi:MAG: substrate-binding domain-containing protein [Planctomycetes bacterium]|nr:substrate-binding domain-containing protein [Planctomycetota bacterium]